MSEKRAIAAMRRYIVSNGGEFMGKKHKKALIKLAKKAGVTDGHQINNLIVIAAYGDE